MSQQPNDAAAPSVREVLTKARELIADEKRWTRDCSARNAAGNYVSVFDDSAACWCASGAIWKASAAQVNLCETAMACLRHECRMGVAGFNDRHTHAEVLAAFDRAIAACEVAQ